MEGPSEDAALGVPLRVENLDELVVELAAMVQFEDLLIQRLEPDLFEFLDDGVYVGV